MRNGGIGHPVENNVVVESPAESRKGGPGISLK
jgi:hypothetical protein